MIYQYSVASFGYIILGLAPTINNALHWIHSSLELALVGHHVCDNMVSFTQKVRLHSHVASLQPHHFI